MLRTFSVKMREAVSGECARARRVCAGCVGARVGVEVPGVETIMKRKSMLLILCIVVLAGTLR